jgi:hypothetical protein
MDIRISLARNFPVFTLVRRHTRSNLFQQALREAAMPDGKLKNIDYHATPWKNMRIAERFLRYLGAEKRAVLPLMCCL